MSTDQATTTNRTERPSTRPVGPFLLWFGVLGGAAAWLTHLLVAWSVTEVACIGPAGGSFVDNRGGSPGAGTWWTVFLGTVLPWLVAAAAFAACLLVRRRQRSLLEEGSIDQLASDRVAFLAVLGTLMNLLSLAAITGGLVAFLVLEPCG